MSSRRNPVAAACVLILLMKVFSGHTLTCQRAEYQIGNECCPMCPPGNRVKTDCTEFRSTSCLPCTEGTFMNQPTGLKQCFSCANCGKDSGLKRKRSCTFISDTVCEPLEGFYCIDSTGDGCEAAQKHKHCQPGQYISQKGTAYTDSVCSDCSEGTFSNGTFESCRPHTQCDSVNLQLIKAGTASTDTVCSDCSEGTFSNGTFESCRPHTQCDSVNLQLIKAGTASTDAECGEHSSTLMTGIVIGVIVFMLMIGTSAYLMYYLKKKERTRNAENHAEEVQQMTALRSEAGPASSALGGLSLINCTQAMFSLHEL
ncbi:tumor necrosis factor receptor superfamily member 14-like isoform X1 [Mastacembelus armatus]|uniref:tumor necrosis factor receptor superfamily member 14-like isoform X1 n=1 Tax=Mastacembelus armatus TaxID=205130 RepID=UPI000E4619E5|nr:tumor necrosis factor receptor superfamily member 14-like isoform X1 [Mastacembelus armatus]